ncbi:MAG: S24/S26 family peptidase [Anaerolineae bacterium]
MRGNQPSLSCGSTDFSQLSEQILRSGHRLRFQARGKSMRPCIEDGDIIEVEPVGLSAVRLGDVVFFHIDEGVTRAHRVVRRLDRDGVLVLLTKGDSRLGFDDIVCAEHVLGRVVAVEREGRRIKLDSGLCRLAGFFFVTIAPFGLWIHKIRIRANRAGCVLRKIAKFFPFRTAAEATPRRLTSLAMDKVKRK